MALALLRWLDQFLTCFTVVFIYTLCTTMCAEITGVVSMPSARIAAINAARDRPVITVDTRLIYLPADYDADWLHSGPFDLPAVDPIKWRCVRR